MEKTNNNLGSSILRNEIQSLSMPNIFNFTDYRVYLSEYVKFRKSTNQRWSYSVWCRSLGIKSRSLISMIINKKRHMSTPLAKSLIEQLELNQKEADYLVAQLKIHKCISSVELRHIIICNIRNYYQTPLHS